jgi:hypothetical protein
MVALSGVISAFGQRRLRQVLSVSGGVETTTDNKLYRWAGLEEIGEYQAGTTNWYEAGTKTRSYLPGLAEVSGSDQSTGAYRHYLNDHLGTPRRILDGAKVALAKHSYTPYGAPLSNAGLPIHVGYTGHTWDNVTSQWFAPYRYYSPSTARWGWRDPLA